MPHVQLRAGLGGRKRGAAFAGRVIEHQLVVAAGTALAGGQLLRFDTREHGVVGMGTLTAGEPGRRIGTGTARTGIDLVGLGIVLAVSVVQGADDHRAVAQLRPLALG